MGTAVSTVDGYRSAAAVVVQAGGTGRAANRPMLTTFNRTRLPTGNREPHRA